MVSIHSSYTFLFCPILAGWWNMCFEETEIMYMFCPIILIYDVGAALGP